MNQQLRNFFEALKASDAGTKVVIAVTAVALIGTMALVGSMAKETHFVPAFPDVSNSDMPAVTKALADASVQMEVRTSGASNSIYVPRDQKDTAIWAAYSAGAITSREKGILHSSGDLSSIFDGADEREQRTRAKEMEEIERILEASEFIVKAEGYQRASTTSALLGTSSETASMVITTVGRRELSSTERQAVSNILRFALGLAADDFSIIDQDGRMVHGGGDEGSGIDDRVLELQHDFNRTEEQRINRYFQDVYGPNLVRVTISSEFDTTQSTTVARTAQKPVKLSGKNYTTETPVGASGVGPDGGGLAGSPSNIADGDGWGSDNVEISTPGGPGGGKLATTSEVEEAYFIPTTSTTEFRSQPTLKHLAVALTLDTSLLDQKAELETLVRAMVGFDEARKDTFASNVTTFLVPGAAEAAEGEGGPAEAPAAGGMDLDVLLERGVEIITALAFVFLLLKGLKGAKGSGEAGAEGAVALAGVAGSSDPELTEAEVDPETLARAQVDKLVNNNPERVAQILSNWVIEDRSVVKN